MQLGNQVGRKMSAGLELELGTRLGLSLMGARAADCAALQNHILNCIVAGNCLYSPHSQPDDPQKHQQFPHIQDNGMESCEGGHPANSADSYGIPYRVDRGPERVRVPH